MLEKDKSNEAKGEFYKYLKAFSKLVVHRKRVVRQATRKLLSYLQYWLMYLNIDNNNEMRIISSGFVGLIVVLFLFPVVRQADVFKLIIAQHLGV